MQLCVANAKVIRHTEGWEAVGYEKMLTGQPSKLCLIGRKNVDIF